MLIGLTGQIGAGKTTAARILAGIGAHVLDADQIGRQVVDESKQLRSKLAHRFGKEILDRNGQVKRKKLAGLAFASEGSKKALNGLVHPYLLKELRRQMKGAIRKHKLVVVDAALLLYWNMDREVDRVLVIHASEKTRFERTATRGISKSDALARQKAQLPYNEFRRRADRIILNNGTREELRAKLAGFLQQIEHKLSHAAY